MKCQYCYAENENGAQFCTNCGAALVQETPADPFVAPVADIVPTTPVTPVADIDPTTPVMPVAGIEPTAPVMDTDPVVPITPVVPVTPVVEAGPAKDPGKTLGLVSLILGIAALVLGSICSCAFPCVGGSFAFALSAAAVITGILGMNKSKAAGFKNTLALIGMILGIAALLVNVICTILGMIGGAAMAESYYYY